MSKFRDSTAGSIVILALVCLVVTAALAGTFAATKEPIKLAKAQAIIDSLKVVLPNGDTFEELDADTLPDNVAQGFKADNDSGYVFITNRKGYGGDVTFIVGMDNDGNYTGIQMTDHEETPGIGSKVGKPDYLEQYYGQADPRGVDTIAGATITSASLQSGLSLATDSYLVATGAAPLSGEEGDGLHFTVLPGVTGYAPLTGEFSEEIVEAYKADDDSGFIFVVTTEGYGGDVTYHVGLDNDGTIVGVDVGQHDETEGIGTKIVSPEHFALYEGLTDGKDVDTVAGSTVTQKSLRKALRLAGENLDAGKSAEAGAVIAAGSGGGSGFAVVPGATSFAPVDADFPEEITEVHKADDAGYVFVVTTEGYGGDVTYNIGLDNDGTILGVDVAKHDETEGIGTKIVSPEHFALYEGLTDGKDVDTVSGSTVTQKSLRKALRLAGESLDAAKAGTVGEAVGASASTESPKKTPEETKETHAVDVIAIGDNFDEIKSDLPEGVAHAYKSTEDAEELAYIFEVVTEGYGGDVTYHVEIDGEGNFYAIEAALHSETEGIGTKIIEADHLDQYLGGNDPKAVDTVSGSTVTQKSLRKALRLSQEAYEIVK